MNSKQAEQIARDFIGQMNPELWDGVGKKPQSFNTLIVTYDINSKNSNVLDISFEYNKEEKTWEHYCELRDTHTEDLVIPLHGYGIDSILNLTETILDICSNE